MASIVPPGRAAAHPGRLSGRACFAHPSGDPLPWSLPVPAARARPIVLAACDRHRLKRLERGQTAPYRQVIRAKIVLLAARGLSTAKIAARLGVTVDTARKWRGRFAAHGLAGLADRKRSGRPPRFTAVQVAGAKASRVLDLYARRFQGQSLGPDEYVLCADEKTSIQARCRCHPTLPPGKARTMRVNHDYDVGRARVVGRCAPSTGIKPFMALVAQVMTQEPYASAKRVFWIVDNGSSHRGKAAIDRLAKRFPNAVMVHTPVHASWLNQAEIYFSVVQRKVVAPNDFTHLDQVRQRLADFEPRYNATARPFRWKFTPADLDDLLARIDRPATRRDRGSPADGLTGGPEAGARCSGLVPPSGPPASPSAASGAGTEGRTARVRRSGSV